MPDNEQQKQKPASEMKTGDIVLEDIRLRDRAAKLTKEYNRGSMERRAEIRVEMQPIMQRENELSKEMEKRWQNKLDGPSEGMGYSR
jgi:hypothetical protein